MKDPTRIFRDYKPETESLLRRLQAAGFELVGVDNGGGDLTRFRPEAFDEFVEEVMGADDAHLFVRHPSNGRRYELYLVYGNEPGYLVCDYHSTPALTEVEEAHNKEWEGKEQPMRTEVANG